ncbi:alpha-E domain-containing protein [Phormidium sp. CCY1219]|uniref:alpha-E domain-containing protein n=1 Tax=Phormidium sp. CCY1219 TaxID=2886104 RepID=UPI002D1EDD15|nr:alpha-E domain-containing protein [Phormidium sp. CCY1219]MEB3829285.1 alpha-E domain-containing protein [Phormidium sp. CCY1219]
MLSRVADSIYWLNRYVERAENIARFVDANLNLILDSPVGMEQQWDPLVKITGDLPVFQERYGEISAENVIHFLTFDSEYPHSILSCLQEARENARSIREIISSEMWEQVNAFYMMVKDAAPGQPLATLHDLFTEVKLASHLFAGVMDATMTHNEGWHFGQIGRLLERADKTSRILDVKYFILLPSVQDVGTTLDEIQWMALLRSASAYEMYRKCQHRITPKNVAEFLVLDASFPRSIRFCLLRGERSLHQITGTPPGTWRDPAERALGRLRSELEYLTIEDIFDTGLHEFLNTLQKQLNHVGDRIFATYFALEPPEDNGSLMRQISPLSSQTQVLIRS